MALVPPEWQPTFVLVLLVAVLVAFASERVRPHFVALGAAAVLIVFGIVGEKEALATLGNPAPFTVGCLFIVAAALDRTGCIGPLGMAIRWFSRGRPFAAFSVLMSGTIGLSAFINNTPVVVMLMPAVFRLAQQFKIAPSKLLMPLSYAAIIGGTCTLIGTSTNLIVDGIARGKGHPGFSLFEIAPLGLTFSAAGFLYLAFVAWNRLPEREPPPGFAAGGDGEPHAVLITEAIVAPGSRFAGHSILEFNLERRYGVRVVAVHKQGSTEDADVAAILQVGDTILVEGKVDDLAQLVQEGDLISVAPLEDRRPRVRLAPIAAGVMAGIIVLSAFSLVSISTAAFIGALIVVATGCLDLTDVRHAIDWPVLTIIWSMLIVGMSLDSSGASAVLVANVAAVGTVFGPVGVVSALYLCASALTEVISNNAVAALLAPIALGLAEALGIDAKPLLVAVMFGASATFATPIGYQTNTLVYTAGGYRYMDFVRIGLPLNIAFWVVATALIPVFFPL